MMSGKTSRLQRDEFIPQVAGTIAGGLMNFCCIRGLSDGTGIIAWAILSNHWELYPKVTMVHWSYSHRRLT